MSGKRGKKFQSTLQSRLLHEMREGAFRGAKYLPSENDLGMNPDQLAPGERSASTSNRNFEGRQGKGGRTHLVSPVVAAATAVRGTLSTPADLPPVSAGAAA